MDQRQRDFARNNPDSQRDYGGPKGKGAGRGVFDCPPHVWQKICLRFPEIAEPGPEGQKAFIKWFNSSASEYYNRFKLRDRI